MNAPYARKITAAVAGSSPRHWMTRRPGECAWPIGDGPDLDSCCAPIVDRAGSYCPTHLAKSLLPTDTAVERYIIAVLRSVYGGGAA